MFNVAASPFKFANSFQDNNGAFFGNFVGTLLASLSAVARAVWIYSS